MKSGQIGVTEFSGIEPVISNYYCIYVRVEAAWNHHGPPLSNRWILELAEAGQWPDLDGGVLALRQQTRPVLNRTLPIEKNEKPAEESCTTGNRYGGIDS